MKYVCLICGYVYDEEKEKVPFSSLPDDWTCPMCGAQKSDFEPRMETQQAAEEPAVTQPTETDLQKLSMGQLAAVCSNLARGCEKQYKTRESELFGRLAEYFTAVTPAVDDVTVEKVLERLKEETAFYAHVAATAESDGDRGAKRVCVWGEKVTRMLSSLVERYLRQGEEMLADAQIWVCTACGFVFVGKSAPETCPVCKVPSWKFERVEQ